MCDSPFCQRGAWSAADARSESASGFPGAGQVAPELVARSLVFLVAELAAVMTLAELLELVRLLGGGGPGGSWLTQAGQAVGVDAELAPVCGILP